MSEQSVVITINTDGTSKVEAVGFTGQSCTLATRDLELVLAGSGSVDRNPKPDFYATVGTGATNIN